MIAWLLRRLSAAPVSTVSPLAGADTRPVASRWAALDRFVARHPAMLAVAIGGLLIAGAIVPPDRLLLGHMPDPPAARIGEAEHARAGALQACFERAEAQSWRLRETCAGTVREGVAK